MRLGWAVTGGRARAAVVLGAALLVVVGTGCWPEEGFDASRAGFTPLETTLRAANVGGLTRAWGANTGATATTPIALGNTVFVGSGDAVEAFDAATGGVRWVTHNNDFVSSGFTGSVGPVNAFGVNVLAPVSWGGGAIGGRFAFDDTTGARTGSPQIHSSIIGSVADRSDASAQVGFAFGSGGPFVTTLGYGTHTAVLSLANPGPSVSSPTIVGRTVLVGVGDTIEAFSLDTCPPAPPPLPSTFCAPVWSAALAAAPRDPVGVGTTEAAIGLANGDVALLDLATGALQWTAHTGSTAATAPAVANGHLYVGAGDGRLYAFTTAGCGQATCAPEWSGPTAPGVAVSHQPAVGADVVYVGTSTGSMYAFAGAGCGATSCPALWNGAVDPSGPAVPVQGPIVWAGTVYASAGNTLAAFRLAP